MISIDRIDKSEQKLDGYTYELTNMATIHDIKNYDHSAFTEMNGAVRQGTEKLNERAAGRRPRPDMQKAGMLRPEALVRYLRTCRNQRSPAIVHSWTPLHHAELTIHVKSDRMPEHCTDRDAEHRPKPDHRPCRSLRIPRRTRPYLRRCREGGLSRLPLQKKKGAGRGPCLFVRRSPEASRPFRGTYALRRRRRPAASLRTRA